MQEVLTYNNNGFNRATYHREKENIPVELAADADYILIWRDKVAVELVDKGRYKIAFCKNPHQIFPVSDAGIFLGIEEKTAVYCVDLSTVERDVLASLFSAGEFHDLRSVVVDLEARDASLLAYAKGMVGWHKKSMYCGACGSETMSLQWGHSRKCSDAQCGSQFFPRIDPAIIVLIERRPGNGGVAKCLLSRSERESGLMLSTFAGFVEIGESLENAVVREMKEEMDVQVERLSYQASQAWPFPSSLMIGFFAEVSKEYFKVDNHEINDAQWYSAGELFELMNSGQANLSRQDSISRQLILTWIENNK